MHRNSLQRWISILFISLLVCSEVRLLAAESLPITSSTSRLLPGEIPGTFRLPGNKTSFGVGGFVETDLSFSDHRFTDNQSIAYTLFFPQIPVTTDRNPEGKRIRVYGNDSRIWFKAYRPSELGELNLYLEYDFNDRAGSYKPHLRHAYVSVGPFLIGKTYTTFTNSSALAGTDSGLPPAGVANRHTQLRWTLPLADQTMDLMLAVEQAESLVNEIPQQNIRHYERDHNPNVALRLNRYGPLGQVSLSAMSRSIHWRDTGKKFRKRANALGFSGRVRTTGQNNLRFMINAGYGLGNFLTPGSYADATYDGDTPSLNTNKVIAAEVSYQHYWSETWRSNLVFSQSRVRIPKVVNPLLTKRASAAQFNVLFSPQPRLTLGVEYLHGSRRVFGGRDGELNRLLLSVRYNFQAE